MFHMDDSDVSDVDNEEIARLVQGLDELDADMFGIDVTDTKGATSKSSGTPKTPGTSKSPGPGPLLNTYSPTVKNTGKPSGKSRLLAEMFPARSDWLGLGDDPTEAGASKTTPSPPLPTKESPHKRPVLETLGQPPTATKSPTERAKFTPTPRRPRSGPVDPLNLFDEVQGVPPNPALPLWLGGSATSVLALAEKPPASLPSVPVENDNYAFVPVKQVADSVDQPRQPSFIDQPEISQNNQRSPHQFTDVLDQKKAATSFAVEQPRQTASSNILEQTLPSNNFEYHPKQYHDVLDQNLSSTSLEYQPSPATKAVEQTDLSTNFQHQSKQTSYFHEPLPSKLNDPIDQHRADSSSLNNHQRSTSYSNQPAPTQTYRDQQVFTSPRQSEGQQKSTRRDESLSPPPRQHIQTDRDIRRDRSYRKDQDYQLDQNYQTDQDYQRDRNRRMDRDNQIDRENRVSVEHRMDRDSRLERLLETLLLRWTETPQPDGQQLRTELDALAGRLRGEMTALAESSWRDALAQEAALAREAALTREAALAASAQGGQRDVSKGMDALGAQLQGLVEALTEHRHCWQRDAEALHKALAQRPEPAPAPAAQSPATRMQPAQRGHVDEQREFYLDESVHNQRASMAVHASQAYFAQDLKQEIRGAFRELKEEMAVHGKATQQQQLDFVDKAERERALFADEMKQGRMLLGREVQRELESLTETINLERASFAEEIRRQRSDFAKELKEMRRESFEEMRKELDSFAGTMRRERTLFKEELKQERCSFESKMLDERDALTAHTSAEAARFCECLAQASSALAVEMGRQREALGSREQALAAHDVALRRRDQALVNAAEELQRMAAVAVDAREQGNAALSAAERLEGQQSERAAELATQLAQLRDSERVRVTRRLAQARQHGIDLDFTPGHGRKISLTRLKAEHAYTMVAADMQLFRSLSSVGKGPRDLGHTELQYASIERNQNLNVSF